MTQYCPHNFEIPEQTRQVANAAFPKGNVYLRIRDEFGPLFNDKDFGDLYSNLGQGGLSPAVLACVTIMQYVEGLTDRQAAEAVRSRIDWKYCLGLALTATGFHHSALGDFRDRLLAGGREAVLFDEVLDRLKGAGLLKGKGKQRTDSTHVVAAIRNLRRVEVVGEGLRRVLDDIAKIAPEWLLAQVTADWFDRYGARIDMYRLPQGKEDLAALQLQIGQDGFSLLEAIERVQAPAWLRELPSVKILGEIWAQQYQREDGVVKWRDKKALPPSKT